MQKTKLFTKLPEYICTPDGMEIDRDGNLILSCPNYAELTSSGCVVKIDRDRQITKWFDVPVHPETGVARNMGIAFDSDWNLYICDNQGWSEAPELMFKGRVLKIKFDENGEVMDGDIIMAILTEFLKRQDKLKKDSLVVTVMSNLGMKKYADENGINLVSTKVGDRYVLEEMLKNGYNLGGEQSGHVIMLDYNPTGDGILTSLMLIKAILDMKKKASEARKIVKIYPQVLINAVVSVDKKMDYEKDEEIKQKIEELEKEFAGNGRVLIRPSGTEPKVRVMIEGENQEYITQKAQELVDLIEQKLK